MSPEEFAVVIMRLTDDFNSGECELEAYLDQVDATCREYEKPDPKPSEEPPKKPCEGFQWIGQPFSSCDRCGLPFWEHTHEEKLDRSKPLFAPDSFELVPIGPELAAAVKAKWDR